MEEILRKALTKAILGAKKGSLELDFQDSGINVDVDFGSGSLTEFLEYKDYYSIIFDHNFAKAVWRGIKLPKGMIGGVDWAICNECKKPLGGWQHHLQQMALEKEPLNYLNKFL